jgi:hypothetical protein
MRKCISNKRHAAPLTSMLYCWCEAGATEYACFPLLLKQLVGPLSLQLADRRSSIVKQVTSLLCQGWARKWLEDLLVLPNSTTFNASSFRLCSCNQLNQWNSHGGKSDSWPGALAKNRV